MVTKAELELLIDATYWKYQFNESNPEVGWGPRLDDIIDGFVLKHNLGITHGEFDYVIEQVKNKIKR